ncbi:hypothetical protein RI129_001136 [Pyrocoelia pectoralis]|uniref:tRNA (32-2'-O)-methyltransferase regulator THADA n=1 Tax=Pyrocoelia pectoralis TaxID=417401 RepID=A0AAN7ZPG9_9COLE
MKPKKIVGPIFRKSCDGICDLSSIKLRHITERCSETTDCCIQQECVKALADYLKSQHENEEKNNAMKLLTHMYLSCTAKHPIKKTITRILLPYDCNDMLSQEFSNSIKFTLQTHTKTQNVTPEDIDHFINSLYTSFDLKAAVTAILENVHELFNCSLNFLNELVQCLWERSKKALSSQLLHTYLYNTTKFLLCISQNYDTRNIILNDKISLIKHLYAVIVHVDVAYEVKCNSGHIMVILLSTLPESFFNDCCFKEYPYLDLLQESRCSSFFDELGIEDVGDAMMKELLVVCLYIGISIVVPPDVLYKSRIGDEIILCFMLETLIDSATCNGLKANISRMMGISKAIASLSSHLCHLDVKGLSCIYRKCLNYINIYIDDVPDIVKNNTQTMFKSLIKITLKAEDEGCLDYFEMLFKWVNNLRGCSNFYTIIQLLCSEFGCNIVLQQYNNLPMQMLHDIQSGKAVNVVTSYERLMKIHRKEVQPTKEWLQVWVDAIVVHLTNSDEPQQLFQALFVAAFKIDSDAVKALIQKEYLKADSEIMALLGCIHDSRKNGTNLNLARYCVNSNNCWRSYLDNQTLTILKTHLNNEIRILVLAIIVDSHSSTEVFTEWELNFMIDYCYYNISTSNASFRQKLLSYVRKAMIRIKDVTNTLENRILSVKLVNSQDLKEKLLQKLNVDVTPVLTAYTKFWNSLFNNVLLPGIHLDSNYSRKVTCLEILNFSSTVIPKPNFEKLWKNCDIENLKHILEYDTYEQNKATASNLLAELSSSFFNFSEKSGISGYLDRCLSMALNIKPSLTISAAYMINLCLKVSGICNAILQKIEIRDVAILNSLKNCNDQLVLCDATYLMVILLEIELSNCLSSAQQNINEAVTTKPTHGLIFCIRYILNNCNLRNKHNLSHWKILIKRIILLCLEISEVANTIVCNDSPEGYVLDDAHVDIDGSAKSQMVTVYGWRATKEISLLFGEVARLYSNNDSEALVNEEQLRCLGQYFFDLLINTKHRGAFEQAAVGFSSLCSTLWRLEGTTVNSLPIQWLDDIKSILYGTSSGGVKSCETRRSAGIPFMVQAILSTEPTTANAKHFIIFMKSLLDVSSNIVLPSEQRILGLNILRALFRHNHFGETVMPYCASGLKIAIRGFSSSTWGVRNSSTLLFSALIIRIFGVQRLRDMELISIKNKMQGQIFFVRFPELYTFLIEEFKVASQERYHPSLYPILIILSRLYSNKETLDRAQLDAFLPYMELCLNNTSFEIRNLAAQANATLIESNKLSQNVEDTIKSLGDIRISNNYCHGLLHKLHYVLCSPHNTILDFNIPNFLRETSWILLLCGQEVHWLIGMYYLENMLRLIIRYDPNFVNTKVYGYLIQILIWQEQQAWRENVTRKYNEAVFNIKLATILHIRNYSKSCTSTIAYERIINADLSKYSSLQHVSLTYLNYIKFTEPAYKNYGLFSEDDSEYADVYNLFLKPLSEHTKSFLYTILLNALWKSIEDNTNNINCELEMLLLHELTNSQKDTVYQLLLQNPNRYIMKSPDEEFCCLILAYLSNNIGETNDFVIKILKFDNLVHVLRKWSSPATETSLRLVLSKFLVHNRKLFYYKNNTMQGSDLYHMWEIVFNLLEDDDEDVRNSICELGQQNLQVEDSRFSLLFQMRVDIPEYTRDLLLNQMVEVLPKEDSIKMLLSLCLRSRIIINDNLSEVFEEGALNTHIEYWPVAKSTSKILYSLLRENNTSVVNYLCDNESIARTLCDTISHNDLPLVSSITKTIVCAVLQNIIQKEKQFSKYNVYDILSNILDDECSLNLDKSELLRIKMLFNQMFKIHLD